MSDLPDDLWTKILDLGINNTKLTYKDLCSISITCKRLYRLSGEDSLWSRLLSYDFPRPITCSSFFGLRFLTDPFCSISLQEIANQPSSSSAKFQYRIRLDRERERKLQEEQRRARLEIWRYHFEFPLVHVQIRLAMLEQENQELNVDILLAKIQELELAQERKEKKVTTADLFSSTKANSKAVELVPDRRYPRERRRKSFTQQTKSWHR